MLALLPLLLASADPVSRPAPGTCETYAWKCGCEVEPFTMCCQANWNLTVVLAHPARVYVGQPGAGGGSFTGNTPFGKDLLFCASDSPGSYIVPAGPITFPSEAGNSLWLRVERGPEWVPFTQEVGPGAAGETVTVNVNLQRWSNMRAASWYSCEFHMHVEEGPRYTGRGDDDEPSCFYRFPQDMPLLLDANDVDATPVLTQYIMAADNASCVGCRVSGFNQHLVTEKDAPFAHTVSTADGPRVWYSLNQELETWPGPFLMLNLTKPVTLPGDPNMQKIANLWPSSFTFQQEALNQEGVHIDINMNILWETPVLLALGKVHSMGIMNVQFQRLGVMPSEAWGRPRGKGYAGVGGYLRNILEIYYKFLDLGFNLPASTGSASSVRPNPVGHNRVYAQLDAKESLSWDGWLRAFQAGRSFVTNGPMLNCTIEADGGAPYVPGHTFSSAAGEKLSLTVDVKVGGRPVEGPLDRAEVLLSGKVVATLRPSAGAPNLIAGRVPVTVDQSAWLAVRAYEVAEPGHAGLTTPNIHYAHTSPWYVSVGGAPRNSPDAAKFFADWIDDLTAIVQRQQSGAEEPSVFAPALEYYAKAKAFYEGRA